MMRFTVVIIGLLVCFTTLLNAQDTKAYERQETQARIAPMGHARIKIEGEKARSREEGLTKESMAPPAEKAPGQAAYESHCIICHADGLAGAPKFQNQAEWGPRIQAEKLEGLLASAMKGLNAMPPKGTCTECTEEDLKNAIQYMLPKNEEK